MNIGINQSSPKAHLNNGNCSHRNQNGLTEGAESPIHHIDHTGPQGHHGLPAPPGLGQKRYRRPHGSPVKSGPVLPPEVKFAWKTLETDQQRTVHTRRFLALTADAPPDALHLGRSWQTFAAESFPISHQLTALVDQFGSSISYASGIAIDVRQGEFTDFIGICGVFLSPVRYVVLKPCWVTWWPISFSTLVSVVFDSIVPVGLTNIRLVSSLRGRDSSKASPEISPMKLK